MPDQVNRLFPKDKKNSAFANQLTVHSGAVALGGSASTEAPLSSFEEETQSPHHLITPVFVEQPRHHLVFYLPLQLAKSKIHPMRKKVIMNVYYS